MNARYTFPLMSPLLLALAGGALFLQGCSESPEPPTPQQETAQPATPAPAATPEQDAHADTHAHHDADETSKLPRSTAPAEARVFFVEPSDGATVSSPLTVRFGLEGMDVVPAGTEKPDSGHHHLLIDLEELPAMDFPLPATEQIVHFGGGHTETTLELPPGEHTLQLVLGDHFHIPHNPPVMSEKITITVQDVE